MDHLEFQMNRVIGKYRAVFESRGGLWRTIRRHGVVRMVDAGLREAWISFGMYVLRLLGRHPGKGYGWFEAVFFPTCEYWLRYAQIAKGLGAAEGGKMHRLIEVSSGRGGFAWVLRSSEVQVCMVDRSSELLSDGRGGNAWRVCADGCSLPFPNDFFDAAVSLDTVEHLPQSLRAQFVQELKRVSRQAVIVTCPLQSGDGEFQGRDFDLQLSRDIAARRGVQPEWLEEHIQNGHPTREMLSELLPGASVNGSESCAVWLRFASLYQRTFFWPVAGLFFVAFLKKRDTVGPYRRAVLVWKKPGRSESDAVAEAANLSETTALA